MVAQQESSVALVLDGDVVSLGQFFLREQILGEIRGLKYLARRVDETITALQEKVKQNESGKPTDEPTRDDNVSDV